VSDFRVSSFDPARERPAPTKFQGHSLDGEERTFVLTRTTLVVAVKPHCDGCHSFVHGDAASLEGVDVLIVSARASDDDEWDAAARDVVISPQLLEELQIRSAPHYVVIDPTVSRVVAEGVPFSPAQVANEIVAFLNT
jgi:hypothetical protein